MKKLLFIFFLIPVLVSGQASIQFPDSTVQLPSNPIVLKGCSCAVPVTSLWTMAGGNSVLFSNATGMTTTISGFQAGTSLIAFTVIDNTGKKTSDTLTLNFKAVKQRTVIKTVFTYDDGTISTLP